MTNIEMDHDIGMMSGNEHGFIENRGQLSRDDIRFYHQGRGYKLGIGSLGLTYALYGEEGTYSFGASFIGSTGLEPTGSDPGDHLINFFTGSDEEKWITGVRTYNEVICRELYPGIDMRYYLNDGQLKYDLIVHPGGDPSSIRIRYNGVSPELEWDAVMLRTPAGDVREEPPYSYSEDGSEVQSRWVRFRDGTMGYDLGYYDMKMDLIIDPGLAFFTYLGGSDLDSCVDVEFDDDGDMYVTGTTSSSNFPTIEGSYQRTASGGKDVFVLKLNATGDKLLYSTYIGGGADDIVYGMALDGSGCPHIVGSTASTNYPTTSSAYDRMNSYSTDVFVTKLDSSGSSLDFSTYIGNYYQDVGRDIAVDPSGYVYVTGYTIKTNWAMYDYPTTSGAWRTTHSGPTNGYDGFISKLNSQGTSLVSSTFVGGNSADYGFAIDVNGTGCPFVTGYTASNNFPTTSGAYDRTRNGGNDIFVTCLNSNFGSPAYSTFIGGGDDEIPYSIKVDDKDNAYICGDTDSSGTTPFPTTGGAYDTSHNGGVDMFLLELEDDGSGLVVSTFFGGALDDNARSLTLDGEGNLYVGGSTLSNDLQTTRGSYKRDYTGTSTREGFAFRINLSSSEVIYSTYIGGTMHDSVNGVALSGSGWLGAVGDTESILESIPPSYDYSYNGKGDGFALLLYPFPFCPDGISLDPGLFHIDVSWNSTIGPMGSTHTVNSYSLYRGEDKSSMEYLAGGDTLTSFNDTINIFSEVEYYYAVTATVEGLGESGFSNITSGKQEVTPIPRIGDYDHGDMFVNLSWALLPPDILSSYDVRYRIHRGLNSSYLETVGEPGLVDWYNDTDFLDIPRPYYYAITYTLKGIGEGLLSDIVRIKPNSVPSMPRNPSLEANLSRLLLSWEPPSDNGGRPVESYRIYRGPSPEQMQFLAAVTSPIDHYVDGDVTPGRKYYYEVRAVNSIGLSWPSDRTSMVARSVPSEPVYLIANPGDGTVTLHWREPEFDWGSPVQGYRIYRGQPGDGMALLDEVGRDVRNYIDNTANGVELVYGVSAYNEHGEGPAKGPVQVMSFGLPGEITGVAVSIGDGSVGLTWEPPEDDGGSPISSYRIYRGATLDSLSPVDYVPGGVNKYRDQGLENGRIYYYKVTALNQRGEGAPSDAVPVQPGRDPSGVGSIRFAASLNRVTIGWDPPSDDGGYQITSFDIYRGFTRSSLVYLDSVEGENMSYSDTDLDPNLTYYYSVCPVNQIGKGPLSAIMEVNVYGRPSSPEITGYEVGPSTINLRWSEPEYDGGSPIVLYRVEIKLEGPNEWSRYETSNTEYNLTQLISGNTYEVRVRGVNAVTEGYISPVLGVLVGDTPLGPRDVKVTSFDRSLSVRWEHRPLTKLPLLHYRLYISLEGSEPVLVTQLEDTKKQYLIEGLSNGAEYLITITSVNEVGEGQPTEPVLGIPSSIPGPVDDLLVEIVDGGIGLTWEPPPDRGGLDIQSYKILRGENPDQLTAIVKDFKGTHYLDTSVIPGRTYHYRIVAVNEKGEGTAGTTGSMFLTGTPGPLVDLRASSTADTVKLSWEGPTDNGVGVTAYLIYRGTSEMDLELIERVEVGSNSWEDRAVSAGTYYYMVVPINEEGAGEGLTKKVDVPGRGVSAFLLGLVSFILPLVVILLAVLLPILIRRRQYRREKERSEEEMRLQKEREKKKKEEEERTERMKSKFGHRATPKGFGGGAAPRGSATHTIGVKREETTSDGKGYIRPERKEKKRKKRPSREEKEVIDDRDRPPSVPMTQPPSETDGEKAEKEVVEPPPSPTGVEDTGKEGEEETPIWDVPMAEEPEVEFDEEEELEELEELEEFEEVDEWG